MNITLLCVLITISVVVDLGSIGFAIYRKGWKNGVHDCLEYLRKMSKDNDWNYLK